MYVKKEVLTGHYVARRVCQYKGTREGRSEATRQRALHLPTQHIKLRLRAKPCFKQPPSDLAAIRTISDVPSRYHVVRSVSLRIFRDTRRMYYTFPCYLHLNDTVQDDEAVARVLTNL